MTAPPDAAVIRVLLADDQTLVRAGFRMVLENDPRIEVVGEAADGQKAVQEAQRLRPDVVLMDIRMPIMDGVEATRRVVNLAELGHTSVVMLTTYELDEYITDALQAGASGFLLKDVEPEELRHAVHVVADGKALLSPQVTRRLLTRLQAQPSLRPQDRERLEILTDREREIVVLVASGKSNDEIATELFISPATAKTHVNRAMGKLQARDRAQLVVIAYRSGLAHG